MLTRKPHLDLPLRKAGPRCQKGLLFLILGLFWVGTPLLQADSSGLKVQTFKTHGRLTVAIDSTVSTQWKNSKQGFELLLKGLSLADLGAPLGEEEQWKAQFKAVGDPRIASLRFSDSAAGVRIEGKWKYPTGPSAPAYPEMEVFEYRNNAEAGGAQSAQNAYIVDFWLKKSPTVAEVQAEKTRSARLEASRKSELISKQRADRKIAMERQRAEIEDVASFCRDPLSEKTDLFLPFLPHHEKVDFSKWLSTRTPDEHFSYFRPTGNDREAQHIRLAQDLYKQGKPALVIRTIEFFDHDFPASKHRHEMHFLKANALIRLGMADQGQQILSHLLTEAQDSPVALYSGMYVAANQIEKGSALVSLESFLWLINHYPQHRLTWVFHLGAAEALYSLKQTERAAKEYEWVVEKGPAQARAQAAVRVGDLFLERFQYEQALAAYYQGLSHFKKEVSQYPSIFVNRAEALYQLGQYDRAKEAFETFLDRYSSHPAGWRAAFRLGEIHGRREGQNAREASRKWFYETINRFPTSPGAPLARLRLMTCDDHGGFTYESMERFMAEDAEHYDGRGEVALKKYKEFRNLAHIRALVTMGKEERAVAMALDELQSGPQAESRPFLRKIVGALFRRSVLQMLAQGKGYDALAFYQDKKDLITKEMPAFQLDFLLQLSQAASDLGLGELGRQLVDSYQQLTKADRSMASADEDLESGMRASEQNFAKAKALWISSGASAQAEIRGLLAKVKEESRFSYEREIILGLLDEAEGKLGSARTHAAKAQVLKTGISRTEDMQLEGWLGSLEARAGESKVAFEIFKNLEKRLELNAAQAKSSVLGLPALPTMETVLMNQGELLEKLGRWSEAATTYGKAVEKGWGGNRAQYGFAKALLKTGGTENLQKGHATLEKLAVSKNDDFWKRLAMETLANDKTAKEGGK